MSGPAAAPAAIPVQAGPAVSATRRPPRRAVWFALGLLTLIAAREFTNRLTWPDALLRPLLVADTAGTADVIVVPGAGLTEACTPNLNSVRRVLLAARMFRAGRAPLVLFSGGRPRAGDLHCAVGDVMARLAEEVGVPAAAIRVERESRTTHLNAELSAPILKGLGARRLLIVTDRLHMVRAAAAYAHYGFAIERASVPIYEGHRDNVDMLKGGLRELVAIAYYRWNGWIENPWAQPPAVAAPATTHAEPSLRLAALVGPPPGPSLERAGALMSQSTTAPPPGPRPIVILGASYAGGWKVASLGGVPVVNAGVAGQQSFELLARFDRDVLPHQPRAVVIWGFANDVFRAPRADIATSLARMRASVREMIARARAHDIEPILATEVTIRPPATWKDWFEGWVGWALRKTSYQEYVNGHILEQNRWIRETARQEGLALLDLQPVVSDAAGVRQPAFAQADGSHISPAGYEALTAYADGALRSRFVRP